MPCEEVRVFDPQLRSLADDLLDTMRAAPGIGITAAHVGVLKRLTVIEITRRQGAFVAVNPRVTAASHETSRQTEGSVSMPGISEDVERPERVRVAYLDLDGNQHEEDFDGLMSICLQHEIDQLDGVFWLDRLSRLKRERAEKRFSKALRLGDRRV